MAATSSILIVVKDGQQGLSRGGIAPQQNQVARLGVDRPVAVGMPQGRYLDLPGLFMRWWESATRAPRA